MSTTKEEITTMKINWMEVLVSKKDIKNFHLSVMPPNGDVKISVPLWTSDATIRNFAMVKLPRIKKHSSKFQWKERQTKREYISWESHYFKGNRYLLQVVPTHANAHAKIELKNQEHLYFYVAPNHTVTDKERFMSNWYRKQLQKELNEIVSKREWITGIKCNKRGIRRMKTMRWSCNHEKKQMRFNLELIKKPYECIEYVVLHELVHIMERTHNSNFVAYMDKFMPQWKLYKNELNDEILAYEKW